MSAATPAIVARGVGKRYEARVRARVDGRRFDIGPDDLGDRDHLWALRGIDFTVQPGTTTAVLGRNGAGKSTLLRLIAAITPPTEGTLEVTGRVGSLLEVGAGFVGELSGRDNVELSGTILGMRRQEVRRRFDEIVDFSGVGAFIDVPVKRYSSGMYLRLAFAVAAHLDAEILLIDEALAVGDREFRDRCLERIRELAAEGRTALFVSHDIQSVARLCTEGLLLQGGRLVHVGDVEECIRRYTEETSPNRLDYEAPDESGTGASGSAAGPRRTRVAAVRVERPEGAWRDVGQPLDVEVAVDVADDHVGTELQLAIDLMGADHWPLTGAVTALVPTAPGIQAWRCRFPTLRLAAGLYGASIVLSGPDGELDRIRGLGPIEVWRTDGVGREGWRYVEDVEWDRPLGRHAVPLADSSDSTTAAGGTGR